MYKGANLDLIEVIGLTMFAWLGIEFVRCPFPGVIFGIISSGYIIWKWRDGIENRKLRRAKREEEKERRLEEKERRLEEKERHDWERKEHEVRIANLHKSDLDNKI